MKRVWQSGTDIIITTMLWLIWMVCLSWVLDDIHSGKFWGYLNGTFWGVVFVATSILTLGLLWLIDHPEEKPSKCELVKSSVIEEAVYQLHLGLRRDSLRRAKESKHLTVDLQNSTVISEITWDGLEVERGRSNHENNIIRNGRLPNG